VAQKNALRYIPESLHETLAPEFPNELITRGRIYGYRYRPAGTIKAKLVDEYKGSTIDIVDSSEAERYVNLILEHLRLNFNAESKFDEGD